MLRAYIRDQEVGEKDDGDWCPCAPAYRDTLDRAGVAFPRSDGTFDPEEVARKATEYAGRRAAAHTGTCITLGELTGWRIWIIRETFLVSPFEGALWPAEGFMAGDPRSGFGVFAFKRPERAAEEARRVSTPWLTVAYGSVRLWGNVYEHARGYRAEYARIASLDGVYPTDQRLDELRRWYGLHFSSG